LRSSSTTKKREPREHSERARRTGADEDRELRRVEQRTGRERELRDEAVLRGEKAPDDALARELGAMGLL
jgi:hypothetical protein